MIIQLYKINNLIGGNGLFQNSTTKKYFAHKNLHPPPLMI